jgi:cytochrome c oxidase cbb3-type subunit 3
MSDFTSGFWSIFITVITLGGILACLLLLWITSKNKQKGSAAGDDSTGHVWDVDLREMNNPLPRWWVWLFIITIVFSLAYLAIYPGLGSFKGKIGWSEVGEYQNEMDQANKALEPIYAKYAAMKVEAVAADPQAKAIGQRLFLNKCALCHGSDARGSKGFPNLTDNDWLHGGTPEKIKESITNGRMGIMPPMAAAIGGTDDDVKNVANYVLSLSGSKHDEQRAALGKPKFETVCAACHGADGKGNQDIGAPNLTDNIWLHGSGEKAIITRIKEGKVNQMPAQGPYYTPEQIHLLTAYVWGLSNMPNTPVAQ